MRKNTITNEMILVATIDYVAQYGLENVTTKKIATSLGISEGSIFNYFPNKKVLLCSCLVYIDEQIDAVLKSVSFEGLSISKNIKEMWYKYFNFLVSNLNYSKFYRQFRHSSYYNQEVIKNQNNSYSFFVEFIKNHVNLFNINPAIFWVFIIETTLNYAIRVGNNELSGKPEDIEKIYQLLSQGFSTIMNSPED